MSSPPPSQPVVTLTSSSPTTVVELICRCIPLQKQLEISLFRNLFATCTLQRTNLLALKRVGREGTGSRGHILSFLGKCFYGGVCTTQDGFGYELRARECMCYKVNCEILFPPLGLAPENLALILT